MKFHYETKEPVSPPDDNSKRFSNAILHRASNLSETSDVMDLNSSDNQGDGRE